MSAAQPVVWANFNPASHYAEMPRRSWTFYTPHGRSLVNDVCRRLKESLASLYTPLGYPAWFATPVVYASRNRGFFQPIDTSISDVAAYDRFVVTVPTLRSHVLEGAPPRVGFLQRSPTSLDMFRKAHKKRNIFGEPERGLDFPSLYRSLQSYEDLLMIIACQPNRVDMDSYALRTLPGVVGICDYLDALHSHASPTSTLDALLAVGIPEAALAQHDDLWQFLTGARRIPFISANPNYAVWDRTSIAWRLRFLKTLGRGNVEAAATYHLHKHLPFIIEGMSAEPFPCDGGSIVLQREVKAIRAVPSLDAMLSVLARLHENADDLLAAAGFQLPAKEYPDDDTLRELMQRFARIEDSLAVQSIDVSLNRLKESVDYHRSAALRRAIHADVKPEHFIVTEDDEVKLADLEHLCVGPLTWEFANAMVRGLTPPEQGGMILGRYGKFSSLSAEQLAEIEAGLPLGCVHPAVKEITDVLERTPESQHRDILPKLRVMAQQRLVA